MTKRPWFKLWVADWIIATAGMTLEEQGAYMRLLTIQWAEGSISGEPKRIALKLGVALDYYDRELAPMVEAHFVRGEDGRMRNPRLEQERAKANDVSETAAENGRKGGNNKASGRHKSASDSLEKTLSESVASQSQSQSQKEKTLEQPSAARFDFDRLYERYPNKKGKADGLKRLRASIKTEAAYRAVERGIAMLCDEVRNGSVKREFVPHFSTWVNGKRWEDYGLPTMPQVEMHVTLSPAQQLAAEARRRREAEFEGQS